MTALKSSSDIQTSFRFFVLALMLGVSPAAKAYEVEFDIGGRFGSASPSAVGAFSWNASKIFGAFAAGTTADGEVSLDTDGNAGIDAYFRGDATFALGSFVSGLRLEAATVRSVVSGEKSIDLSLSAPCTLNGSDLSLSFAPVFGAGFLDNESVKFGANASVSYLAGDFVLKPGAAISQMLYADGTRTLEITPTVGFVWYPGLPVSADFSIGWSRSETEAGSVSTSYPVSAALSAVPLPWLCLTAKYQSEGSVSGVLSHRAEGELELIHYGGNGNAFHLPVAAYYTWSDGGSVDFGVSVMVGFSFGQE